LWEARSTPTLTTTNLPGLPYGYTNILSKIIRILKILFKKKNRINNRILPTLLQGTPDEIRKKNFRKQWNASGLAGKIDIDMESTDPDLIEADLESEGSSHDDTTDSVVSFLKIPILSYFLKTKIFQDKTRAEQLSFERPYKIVLRIIFFGRLKG
jgi:hypothetical protein